MPELKLSPAVKKVLWNRPFGKVYPQRPNPAPLAEDGRTVALKTLARYFADLTFYRAGGRDKRTGQRLPPIPFQIPPSRLFVEWPDDEADQALPAIALLAQAPADFEAIGMTAYIDESSRDRHGPGTVAIWLSEYVEEVVIELWADTKAQRRGMLVGVEQAMSPFELMSGLRFLMPDYYDQLCCFELLTREVVDDEEAVRVRRKARFVARLRFNCVAVVNVEELNWSVVVEVKDNQSAIDTDAPTQPPTQVPEIPEPDPRRPPEIEGDPEPPPSCP